MKTVKKTRRSKPFKTAALATLMFSLFAAVQVQAADTTHVAPAEIKYLGTFGKDPVFQINVNNQSGEITFLSLRDEYGNTLYSEWVKQGDYSRRIRFEEVPVEDVKITLTLRSKKGYQKQTYQINRNIRTIEDVEIAQL
ncbi:MAG: hypothetical protein ICV81_07025 [Flavisolibacter sp.]|nr:hypothetical protein [Flavisolibacter sp.]